MLSESSQHTKGYSPNTVKSETLARYNSLESLLDDSLNEIRSLPPANEEVASLTSDLIQTLLNRIEDLKYEVNVNLKNLRWDKLVIAFFGMTGAGKSTIIETFRILFDPNRDKKRDGAIVGDGRPDYTKEAKEYELTINGQPFVLVDVPGIEGNEELYRKTIYEALSKAHIVFYVYNEDKIPDEGTAGKIKSYLANWSRVYSIQNVFKGASDYDEEEDRKTLLTEDIRKTKDEIKSKFQKLLGNSYEGNVPIQALLALCSTKADFSSEKKKLDVDQSIILNYFQDADEVMKFSRFQTLLDLVEDKAKKIAEEIDRSNLQKVIGYAKKISLSIDDIIERHKDEIENKLQLLKDYKGKVNIEFSKLSSGIGNRVIQNVYDHYNTLVKDVQKELNAKGKKKDKKNNIRRLIISFYSNQPYRLQKVVQNEVDTVLRHIRLQTNKIEEVNQSLQSALQFQVDFKLDMNALEDGIKELDFNLDDAGDLAEAAAKGLGLGALGGAIGMGIGAGVGSLACLVKKHFFHKGDKKASALESIITMLEESRHSVEQGVKNQMPKLRQQIDSKKEELLSMVDMEIKNVERVEDIKDELDQKIKKIIK